MKTKEQKIFSNPNYKLVNGLIIAETNSHLLIDATYNGTKMVQSNLKFIVKKDSGYWFKLGWNHPMNDTRNYEEGYDIIQLFNRQYGGAAEYYFYLYYGRIPSEVEELKKYENHKIKEILNKRFSSREEMKVFLSSYIDERGSFKDIGINNTHGGGIISAHTIEELYNKL